MKLILLAATTASDSTAPSPIAIPTEIKLVLIAVGLIILGVVIWAAFLRRSSEEVSGWGPAHSHYRPPAEKTGDSSGSGRRRRRRRRREHRPRNPTLAETGGLPPMRPNEPSDPSP
jgi:hypothetical protein